MIPIPESLVFDAGGILACSRWSSAATPPEYRHHSISTPVGVPAVHRHALDAYIAPLSPGLRNQEPGTAHRSGMAVTPARVSRRCCSRFECRASGRGRSGRSRASSRRPQAHALPLRFHARIEEGIFQLGRGDNPDAVIPLAGGLWSLHRQRFGSSRCSGLHRQTRGTPPPADVPGGQPQANAARLRATQRNHAMQRTI